MKMILAFVCLLAVVSCKKMCAPDMYVQEFIQLAGTSTPDGAVSTSDSIYIFYADYKNNMILNNLTSLNNPLYDAYTIDDHNQGVRTYVYFASRTCKDIKLEEKMPPQCRPDDTETIATYTNLAGQVTQVIRFKVNNETITQTNQIAGETEIPVVQTIAMKNDRGAIFVTQLFGPAAATFDRKVLQKPSFCK